MLRGALSPFTVRQVDNITSPTNLKTNFCTFLSILYKTAGKLVVFFEDLLGDALLVLLTQINVFSALFSQKLQKFGSIYSPKSEGVYLTP